MRIGLFTDFYHPAVNGISFVVDILRNNLEKQGHEVYIVAPVPAVRRRHLRRDNHIIRFTAVKGMFFDEQLTSLFFPPKQLKRIAGLDLDVIVMFTPAQIGLMGAYAALRLDIPVVMQYSTDLIEYVEHYPAVMAGVFGLFLSAPLALKLPMREVAGISRRLLSKQNPELSWRQDMIATMLGVLHGRCDAIVAVSPKVAKAMHSFGLGSKFDLIPTGVDALPVDARRTQRFAKQYHLQPDDEVLLYVGRLAPEKNLDVLIDAFNLIAEDRPKLKLLFVGNFNHREHLEGLAVQSPYRKRIAFTGMIPREQLGSMYALGSIFLFPSLTDTQGLTLNEAAHAGLPMVWCDHDLNDVLVDGKNGYRAKPTARAISQKILAILDNPSARERFSAYSRRRAAEFSEASQTKKLADLLSRVIEQRR